VAAQYQGNPTGDVNFVFPSYQTHRIVVDTCGFASPNHISTSVRVYSKCRENGGHILGNQTAGNATCSVLVFDIHR